MNEQSSRLTVSSHWAYLIIFVTAIVSAGVIYYVWSETDVVYGIAGI